MKITRLAAALSLSLITLSTAQAAKYRIVEIPLSEKGVQAFAGKINESGDVVTTVQTPINPPIDIELINFDNDFLVNNLTDLNAAQVGNINTDDLLTLFNFVKTGAGNQFFQQLADIQSHVYDGSDTQPVLGFDVIDAELEGFTFSNNTIAYGINNSSAIVGVSSDPFYKVDYRTDAGVDLTFVVNDFNNRAFLDINNQTIEILPPDETAGGVSQAFDINNSFEVAGYATTEVTEGFESLVEGCEEEELRGDLPLESCIRTVLSGGIEANFQRRGMIWQFDASGSLLDERELGLLLTPPPGDETLFVSRAVAINDNGLAVGTSQDYVIDGNSFTRTYAAIFDGDQVHGYTNKQEYTTSVALDINNDNIVVGSMNLFINGTERSKFYYYDYDAEILTFPDDFFESSASIARAINNNGLVVGEGQVDTDLIGSRRSEAFLYNISEDSFQNVNDLVSCDTPYTIVQANDINDNDEISATAVVFRERKNIIGEIDLNDQGNVIREGMSVAVKLIPIIGGEIDDCQLEPDTLERKSGSTTIWSLLLLLPIAIFNRKRKTM